MKKIFTLLAAAMCSMMSFAQDISFETRDGVTIENGSAVTVEGRFDFQLFSDIHVRNNSASKQLVYAQVKAVSGGEAMFCFGGNCAQIPVGNTSDAKSGLVEAGAAVSLEVEAMDLLSSVITRTVEITAWTEANPDAKITATVTFTNDPAVLAGVESAEVNVANVYAKDNVLNYSFAQVADRQLQIFDIAGQLQQNVRLTSEAGSLSLEGMTKGLYIYRVMENGRKAVSGKFFVK